MYVQCTVCRLPSSGAAVVTASEFGAVQTQLNSPRAAPNRGRNLISTTALLFCLQLRSADWSPDFGPAEFVPNWGATIAGARKFLIAYNVNLLATKEQAHRIALDIREQGRGHEQVDC